MSQVGWERLMPEALSTLRRVGYRHVNRFLSGCSSRNVYCLEKDGKQEFVLIQCRSCRPGDDRYLVGLIVEALQKVESVALFFEGESRMLKIPAAILRQILCDRVDFGDARFTGNRKEQWRVDFYVSEAKMSPQGSEGRKYDLGEHVIEIT
jgi:hypothetical protein